MQVLMGIGYNLSLRMSFMICRIKKRLKKIEDIMKKVMFINKTIAITNKGYSGEERNIHVKILRNRRLPRQSQ